MSGQDWSVDHIGIAVDNLETAIPKYRALLGRDPTHTEEVESEGVRVCFFELGDAHIELLEPMHDESPIRKFLDKGRKGIHHIAIKVPEELQAVLPALEEDGVQPLGSARPGSRGKEICFIHPKSTEGVLVELVGEARADDRAE